MLDKVIITSLLGQIKIVNVYNQSEYKTPSELLQWWEILWA